MTGRSAVAVDLGGTKTTAGLVLEDGQVGLEVTAATPGAAGAAAVVATTADLVHHVLTGARAAGASPCALGVGTAGVVDRGTGTITSATDHILGWAGTAVGDLLGAATGLRAHVLNDVHAHALGESRCGAGRGRSGVLVVAVGTGVGGAFVHDGRVLAGASGAAGHFGHVPSPEAAGLPCSCGASGHVEAVASGPGLVALHHRLGGSAVDAKDVVGLARDGDGIAGRAVTVAATALGRALGGWVNALDPDVVVLTGGLAGAGPLWWEQVVAAARDQLVPAVRTCQVVRAELGHRAALVGAAAHAGLLESQHGEAVAPC